MALLLKGEQTSLKDPEERVKPMRLSILLPTQLLMLFILITVGMSGCVTHYRAEAIETKLLVLESKLDQLKEDVNTTKSSQDATLEHINSKFEAFQKEMLSIIDSIRRGSAEDVGTLDELQALISQQRGELSKLSFELSQLKERREAAQVTFPEDKEQLYQQAEKFLVERSYREAITFYSEFVKRYPEDVRADDCLFSIAKAYYQQNRYEDCVRAVQQIINEYPDENQADKALILLHDAFLALDQCSKARQALEFLKQRYPRSNQLRIAERKLQQLKKCK